jgi:diadenosine tetraphosphate (Ap4A) HIT family hydrolase
MSISDGFLERRAGLDRPQSSFRPDGSEFEMDFPESVLRTVFDGCCLCSRAARPQSLERLASLPPEELILAQRNGFVVSGARGAFIEGWLLIFPRAHVTALQHLRADQLEDLSVLVRTVKQVFASAYDRPLLAFEHGSPADRTCHTGRCVDHAHLHCIPTEYGIAADLARQFPYERLDSLSDLSRAKPADEPYILCSNADGSFNLIATGVIPSQWMRQLLAARAGVAEQWDWRIHPMENVVSQGNRQLMEALRKRLSAECL